MPASTARRGRRALTEQHPKFGDRVVGIFGPRVAARNFDDQPGQGQRAIEAARLQARVIVENGFEGRPIGGAEVDLGDAGIALKQFVGLVIAVEHGHASDRGRRTEFDQDALPDAIALDRLHPGGVEPVVKHVGRAVGDRLVRGEDARGADLAECSAHTLLTRHRRPGQGRRRGSWSARRQINRRRRHRSVTGRAFEEETGRLVALGKDRRDIGSAGKHQQAG